MIRAFKLLFKIPESFCAHGGAHSLLLLLLLSLSLSLSLSHALTLSPRWVRQQSEEKLRIEMTQSWSSRDCFTVKIRSLCKVFVVIFFSFHGCFWEKIHVFPLSSSLWPRVHPPSRAKKIFAPGFGVVEGVELHLNLLSASKSAQIESREYSTRHSVAKIEKNVMFL